MDKDSKSDETASQEIFSPEDLCERWKNKVQPSTLKEWRRQGKGPEFFRLSEPRGPVLYRIEDIRAWELSKRNLHKS